MIDGIQLKVCGLTSLADAACAESVGADFLGFILYPKSPRYISLREATAFAGSLAKARRVAVSVEPEARDLLAMRDAGFGLFQVHFRHDLPLATVESWSRAVGADSLWLAPRLPPGVDLTDAWMGLCSAFLFDTFDPVLFGGTGRTGDWQKFARLRDAHPGKTWILSGGINPENVGDALAGTGARFVDVNSGVESSPGKKDHAKLAAFVAAVRGAAAR